MKTLFQATTPNPSTIPTTSTIYSYTQRQIQRLVLSDLARRNRTNNPARTVRIVRKRVLVSKKKRVVIKISHKRRDEALFTVGFFVRLFLPLVLLLLSFPGLLEFPPPPIAITVAAAALHILSSFLVSSWPGLFIPVQSSPVRPLRAPCIPIHAACYPHPHPHPHPHISTILHNHPK